MLQYVISFFSSIYVLLIGLIRRVSKLFMRKITRLCELQRIVYGELRGCRRFKKVEASLNNSKNLEVKKAILQLEKGVTEGRFNNRGTRASLLLQCAVQIVKAKNINIKLHSKFVNSLVECLEVIYAFKWLNLRVQEEQDTPYSSDNPDHETMLLQLWENLMLEEKLSARKSKQWQIIGFQGNDPATDFRGAGILALQSMLHISNCYPNIARRLLENSQHPRYSYPFALVGIQLSYLASELCLAGYAKTHFYNRYGLILRLDDESLPSDQEMWGNELMKLFFDFCTSLVVDFDVLWMSCKPKDIMEYSRIKTAFDNGVINKLRNDDACFLMEIQLVAAIAHLGYSVVPADPRLPHDPYSNLDLAYEGPLYSLNQYETV